LGQSARKERAVSKDFHEDRPIDATWIQDGEKHALIGLNVKLDARPQHAVKSYISGLVASF
jgi:hypothetical protein